MDEPITQIEPVRRGWECPSCKHRWMAEGAKPSDCPMCGRRAGETHAKLMRRLMCKHNGVRDFREALADNERRNRMEDERNAPPS